MIILDYSWTLCRYGQINTISLGTFITILMETGVSNQYQVSNDFQAYLALIVYAFFIFKFDLFWLTVIRIYIYVHIIVGILLPLGIIPKVPHQGQAL